MMKTWHCLCVALAASALGCAVPPSPESTSGYFDDATITTKVRTAIFGEPSITSSQVHVETFRGVVQLRGFVRSPTAISKATEAAGNVRGVVRVRNDLRLLRDAGAGEGQY